MYTCHIFIQSFVNGHLGGFHILAIITSATVNFGVHVSFLISGFFFSGYTRRSRIAGFEVDTSHVFLWGGARDGGPRAGVGREVGLPFCSMAVTLLLGRGSDPKLLEKKP